MYVFLRDCGDPRDCREPLVLLRTPFNRMVTVRSCCASDLCRVQVPQVIPDGSPNGRTCPGCLTIYSNRCETQIPVLCRDNEINCFTFSSRPQNNSNNEVFLAMSGCASGSACGMEILSDQRIQCVSGAGAWNLPLPPRLLLLLMALAHGLHTRHSS
ncbi:hypothetical protein XENTR_v10017394 [Xenopus tropicalis]|uniref:Phospholipase A2 inhibitor subunit gamma B-like n=1 Tax=Xenopus tropicalis TaxID=8364 RepID=A0A8J0SAE6_XENTR|nr:phospholipase A2 inhibitor subunit gamma B-like [Xenopus tropicalis]KAE8599907.1 hypothetical protein XENTR_v10017394 [Xenopus tropicalis]|eukprot:XP_012809379.1 PREDICTED: phospholipase A2 inhibitor subunit gamma B-like [Xenopus tropicalis]